MRTSQGRIERLLISAAILLVLSSCSTSKSAKLAADNEATGATTSASSANKSGYVDPLVSNASSKRKANANSQEEPGYAQPAATAQQDMPTDDGLAEAVGRPSAIKAGSSSIYSTTAPQPEYAPEEPATGPVPAYIPPTGINATRGSVFSTRTPQAPQQ